jgi:hypothetical protein
MIPSLREHAERGEAGEDRFDARKLLDNGGHHHFE